MANTDFSKLRRFALKLIKKSGGAMQLIEPDSSGEDRFGNATTVIPGVTIDGFISPLFDYSESKNGEYENKDSKILSGDKYAFYQSEDDTEIKIGMVATVNGIDYIVQSISFISSINAVRALTKLQLRS